VEDRFFDLRHGVETQSRVAIGGVSGVVGSNAAHGRAENGVCDHPSVKWGSRETHTTKGERPMPLALLGKAPCSQQSVDLRVPSAKGPKGVGGVDCVAH